MNIVLVTFFRASAIFVLALFTCHSSYGQSPVFSLEYDEQQPLIAPDGQLFFTLAYHPQNIGGIRDSGDVWFASEEEQGFGSPKPVPDLSTKHYDLLIGFVHRDTALVYHSNLNNQQAIQRYFWDGLNWEKGKVFPIPGFKIDGEYFSASLDPTREIMVMSMDSFGSYGNEDIYISRKIGDSWSRPINIGDAINTTKQELSPRLSSSGDSLYFATNAYENQKGIVVYVSKRLDNTWKNWSQPMLLELSQMQGIEMDYFQDPLKNRSFFTNTQTSEGFGNIFALEKATPKTISPISKIDEAKSQPPNLTVTENRLKPVTKTEKAIPSNAQQESEIVGNIVKDLDSLAIGEGLILDDVLFQRASVNLLDSTSLFVLDELATFLIDHPKKKILIEGHTDSYGSANINMRLSSARAYKIKELLVKRGVSEASLQTIGRGGKRPIATNSNEEGRKRNRRVEIKLIAEE